jgi:uncharacterized protein YrrD
MEPALRTSGLIGRLVVIRDVRLGVVVDALFDTSISRLVGFDVGCGDGANRFLPLPACDAHDDRLEVQSTLVLLDRELGFYRAGGRSFAQLRDQEVSRDGERVGPLADVVVDSEGNVVSVIADGVDLPAGPGLALGDQVLRPAV